MSHVAVVRRLSIEFEATCQVNTPSSGSLRLTTPKAKEGNVFTRTDTRHGFSKNNNSNNASNKDETPLNSRGEAVVVPPPQPTQIAGGLLPLPPCSGPPCSSSVAPRPCGGIRRNAETHETTSSFFRPDLDEDFQRSLISAHHAAEKENQQLHLKAHWRAHQAGILLPSTMDRWNAAMWCDNVAATGGTQTTRQQQALSLAFLVVSAHKYQKQHQLLQAHQSSSVPPPTTTSSRRSSTSSSNSSVSVSLAPVRAATPATVRMAGQQVSEIRVVKMLLHDVLVLVHHQDHGRPGDYGNLMQYVRGQLSELCMWDIRANSRTSGSL